MSYGSQLSLSTAPGSNTSDLLRHCTYVYVDNTRIYMRQRDLESSPTSQPSWNGEFRVQREIFCQEMRCTVIGGGTWHPPLYMLMAGGTRRQHMACACLGARSSTRMAASVHSLLIITTNRSGPESCWSYYRVTAFKCQQTISSILAILLMNI